MSGGSWNYASSKVSTLAEELRKGEERDEPDKTLAPGEQHPLRTQLAGLMEQVAEVMRAIEWSDSGDTSPDAWIAPCKKLLTQCNIVEDDYYVTVSLARMHEMRTMLSEAEEALEMITSQEAIEGAAPLSLAERTMSSLVGKAQLSINETEAELRIICKYS